MIPFFTLERQNKIIKKEIKKAIEAVFKSGNFILGEKVAQFESAFAKYLGVRYAVGVASGTDALSLAMLAVGVGQGDEVILPANAYPTAFSVTAIGAKPVLVDIEPDTFNIDPQKIISAISKKTKAIIPVHMYGRPAEMEDFFSIIYGSCRPGIPNYDTSSFGRPSLASPVYKRKDKHQKIYIIEDCAQAHGAEAFCFGHLSHLSYLSDLSDQSKKTWKVGAIGDIGCFSFYPTKNLGCFGDGGMVVTNHKKIYERVKLLRMYGESKRYKSVLLGRNSRLDEIQAAILLVKLKYLDRWNERRKEIASKYLSHLGNLSDLSQAGHVYHLFVIRAKQRDKLMRFLQKKGIATAIHYPTPVHLVPSFSYLGYKKGDFPQAEKAAKEVVSLPMFPELSFDEVEEVAEAVKRFYKSLK